MEMALGQKVVASVAAAALALSLGAGLVGCSSSSSTKTASKDSNGVTTIDVTLKDNKVELSSNTAEAGPVKFNVKNESATAISEVELLKGQKIVGEKENLAPGLDAVSFTTTLSGGDYKIYAPGATEPYTEFKVTGDAAAAPSGSTQDILKSGVTEYAAYIKDMMNYLYDAVDELNTAVQKGDVAAAKTAWAKARPFYERAESAVDGFIKPGGDPENNLDNLDYLIDMRESNLDESAGWHGFHAIERDLWQAGAITDSTKAYSAELLANVKILRDDVIPTFADDLLPEDLANGAADLLEEVSTTKITGEEDLYSHLDLADFRANVEGAQQAYANLRDGLNKIDPDLVTRIDSEFQTVSDLLDTYRDESQIGGYVPYTDALKASDSKKLSEPILALHDDLASLAEKVVTA